MGEGNSGSKVERKNSSTVARKRDKKAAEEKSGSRIWTIRGNYRFNLLSSSQQQSIKGEGCEDQLATLLEQNQQNFKNYTIPIQRDGIVKPPREATISNPNSRMRKTRDH